MSRAVGRFALASVSLVVALSSIQTGISGQQALSQSSGQPSTRNGEWPHYNADLKGSRYSPLDQITADNFKKLEIACRFKTDTLGKYPDSTMEVTLYCTIGV